MNPESNTTGERVFVLHNSCPLYGWAGKSHKPVRDWKKSQKKIRRERRQRGFRK